MEVPNYIYIYKEILDFDILLFNNFPTRLK